MTMSLAEPQRADRGGSVSCSVDSLRRDIRLSARRGPPQSRQMRPPTQVIAAFGGDPERLTPLPGGQGTSWRAGPIVLKPAPAGEPIGVAGRSLRGDAHLTAVPVRSLDTDGRRRLGGRRLVRHPVAAGESAASAPGRPPRCRPPLPLAGGRQRGPSAAVWPPTRRAPGSAHQNGVGKVASVPGLSPCSPREVSIADPE